MEFEFDIPDEDLAQIDRISAERCVSRNDLFLEALRRYFALHASKTDLEVDG
jgi:metal-responsive CopG/Arc/MetJ family transcriptional regulator